MTSPYKVIYSLPFVLDDESEIDNFTTDLFSVPDIDVTACRTHRSGASLKQSNDVTLIAVSCGAIMTVLRHSLANNSSECLGDTEFDASINSVCWDPAGQCILVAQGNGKIHFALPSGKLLLSHTILSAIDRGELLMASLLLTASQEFPMLHCITEGGSIIVADKVPVAMLSKLSSAGAGSTASPAVVAKALTTLKIRRYRLIETEASLSDLKLTKSSAKLLPASAGEPETLCVLCLDAQKTLFCSQIPLVEGSTTDSLPIDVVATPLLKHCDDFVLLNRSGQQTLCIAKCVSSGYRVLHVLDILSGVSLVTVPVADDDNLIEVCSISEFSNEWWVCSVTFGTTYIHFVLSPSGSAVAFLGTLLSKNTSPIQIVDRFAMSSNYGLRLDTTTNSFVGFSLSQSTLKSLSKLAVGTGSMLKSGRGSEHFELPPSLGIACKQFVCCAAATHLDSETMSSSRVWTLGMQLLTRPDLQWSMRNLWAMLLTMLGLHVESDQGTTLLFRQLKRVVEIVFGSLQDEPKCLSLPFPSSFEFISFIRRVFSLSECCTDWSPTPSFNARTDSHYNVRARCIALMNDPLLEQSFRSCLAQGSLIDAAFLFRDARTSHTTSEIFALPMIVRALQTLVPTSAMPTQVCTFARDVCIPLLLQLQGTVEGCGKGAPNVLALNLAAELCKRALLVESLAQLGSHVYATNLVSVALRVLDAQILDGAWMVPAPLIQNEASSGFSASVVLALRRVQHLHQQLVTLGMIKASTVNSIGAKNLADLCLNDVISFGINGIVFQGLWEWSSEMDPKPDSYISEELGIDTCYVQQFEDEIDTNVRHLLIRCGVDTEKVLLEWIQRSIQQCIITVQSCRTDTDEYVDSTNEIVGSNVTEVSSRRIEIWKLVVVARNIKDLGCQAQAVLDLLQVPVLASSVISGGCNAVLCQLAQDCLVSATSGVREALTEAIRLQQIRSLAFKYGILNLDPRNSTQVKTAAALMAARVYHKSSIPDSLQLIQAWGSSNYNVSALLVRAIVHRATCSLVAENADSDGLVIDKANYRNELLLSAIASIPVNRISVVVEDSSACLMGMMEDCSMRIQQTTRNQGEHLKDFSLADPINREWLSLIQSQICILSWYLDHSKQSTADTCGSNGEHDSKVDLTVHTGIGSCRNLTAGFLANLRRGLALFLEFGICLTPSEMQSSDACTQMSVSIAGDHATRLIQSVDGNRGSLQESEMLPVRVRRICSLLNVSLTIFVQHVVSSLLTKNAAGLAIQMASLLTQSQTNVSASLAFDEDRGVLIDASVALCGIAAKQIMAANSSNLSNETVNLIASAFQLSNSLLQECVVDCPPSMLPSAVHLLGSADLVVGVLARVEGAAGSHVDVLGHSVSKTNLYNANAGFKISESHYTRDGILLSAGAVLGPIIKFVLRESQRRNLASSSGGNTTNSSTGAPAIGNDLDEIVAILQRSENHVLASRIMLYSWLTSVSKAQMLRSSLFSLARKLLAYHHVDVSYVISVLSLLPYEAMVKELKSAVPSIQSDFSRLRTVAVIGEELAQLWDQETLLGVFQTLQVNAKWWHTLSELGIQIDPRTLQSSDAEAREAAMKAVVPILLERSGENLELAKDYCRQFSLESDIAALCYIERQLLSPHSSVPSDMRWAVGIRQAATGVAEDAVISLLRTQIRLKKLNPVQYERINYVCSWILNEAECEEDPIEEADESFASDDLADETMDIRSLIEEHNRSREEKSLLTAKLSKRESNHCKMLVDVTNFLSTLTFPKAILARSSFFEGCNLASKSDVFGAHYSSRLPIWSLLSQPVAVLDFLFANCPEDGMKLLPMCNAMKVSRDEFYIRLLRHRFTSSFNSSETQKDNINQTQGDVAINDLEESVHVLTQVRSVFNLWRWVFEQSRQVSDSTIKTRIGLRSLQNALNALGSGNDKGRIAMSEDEIGLLMSQCNFDILRLRVRASLEKLISSPHSVALLPSLDVCESLILQSPVLSGQCIDDPAHLQSHPCAQLSKRLLSAGIDVCWRLHVQYVSSTIGRHVVHHLELLSSPLSAQAITFAHQLSTTIDDIMRSGVPDADNSAVGEAIDNILSVCINKFLADVDVVPSGPSAPVDSWVAGQHPGTKKGMLGSTNPRGTTSTWDLFDTGCCTRPSPADGRRKVDIFLACALAVVICTAEAGPRRAALFEQIVTVATGTSIKGNRRLTARSRFRAAQCMYLLEKLRIGTLSHASIGCLRAFCFIVAEQQEVRLLCSEESLVDALGIRHMVAINGGQTGSGIRSVRQEPAAPSAVLKTWLHDEGSRVEAVELARDLIVASELIAESKVQDYNLLSKLWMIVLEHACQFDFQNVLLQCLLWLQSSRMKHQLRVEIQRNSYVMSSISTLIGKFVEEVMGRLHTFQPHHTGDSSAPNASNGNPSNLSERSHLIPFSVDRTAINVDIDSRATTVRDLALLVLQLTVVNAFYPVSESEDMVNESLVSKLLDAQRIYQRPTLDAGINLPRLGCTLIDCATKLIEKFEDSTSIGEQGINRSSLMTTSDLLQTTIINSVGLLLSEASHRLVCIDTEYGASRMVAFFAANVLVSAVNASGRSAIDAKLTNLLWGAYFTIFNHVSREAVDDMLELLCACANANLAALRVVSLLCVGTEKYWRFEYGESEACLLLSTKICKHRVLVDEMVKQFPPNAFNENTLWLQAQLRIEAI